MRTKARRQSPYAFTCSAGYPTTDRRNTEEGTNSCLLSLPTAKNKGTQRFHFLYLTLLICLKCSGERPKCDKCITFNVPCQYAETETRIVKRKYEELRHRRRTHEELFNLLRAMSEVDAISVLRRIRAGGDVNAILTQIQDGNLLTQLSLMPETRRRYELPYLSDMPPSVLVRENPYLHSLVHQTTFECPKISLAASQGESVLPELQHMYLKPYHAAEMDDSVLLGAAVSRWTSVSSDDRLLRQLLGAYFVHQYPCYFPLHKDVFLDDMAAGRSRFCSPLLVNALLAAGCQSYHKIPGRHQFWLPQNLGYQFTAEAKRLWELERPGDNRITTIQAAIVLNIVVNLNGLDRIGRSYLEQALAMAQELRLFEESQHPEEEQMRKARTVTSWALFSWQTVCSFYFFRKPYLENPPESPLPDPVASSQWYGEVWLRYPQSPTRTPSHVGSTFKARTGLRTIMNEIALDLFGKPQIHKDLLYEKVLQFKSSLDAWVNSLPDGLTPSKIVFPTQFELQYVMLNFDGIITKPG